MPLALLENVLFKVKLCVDQYGTPPSSSAMSNGGFYNISPDTIKLGPAAASRQQSRMTGPASCIEEPESRWSAEEH
ncbi:hypothetical protein RRG08_054471 [Elysia crispata]|uniref:Uncharacterized protein n=1 Tax=Elysia crispata TaxID=231223 RepID=A0AAE0Y6Y8_9GAST|nr:hypothetical protein RRG08_054471 [Elysia crispata]